jgi:hypothetical protein
MIMVKKTGEGLDCFALTLLAMKASESAGSEPQAAIIFRALEQPETTRQERRRLCLHEDA